MKTFIQALAIVSTIANVGVIVLGEKGIIDAKTSLLGLALTIPLTIWSGVQALKIASEEQRKG